MPKYVYSMQERPPGPGAQPREGLIDVWFYNGTKQHIWGFAIYNRELTPEEQEHYCMKPAEVIELD